MTDPDRQSTFVDVLFALEGRALPKDYRFLLMREIGRHLPWFESDDSVGMHPIKASKTDYGVVLLPRRAKLILRLPRARVTEVRALIGAVLNITGHTLRVGEFTVRPIQPFGTLYAYFVVDDTGDELAFIRRIEAQLDALSVPCSVICGQRGALQVGARALEGYSLMLHGLAAPHSVRLQETGLGSDRNLGCGMFVPHKSVVAVGA